MEGDDFSDEEIAWMEDQEAMEDGSFWEVGWDPAWFEVEGGRK